MGYAGYGYGNDRGYAGYGYGNGRYYADWNKQCKYEHYESWYGKTNYELLQENKKQPRKLEATVLHLLAG